MPAYFAFKRRADVLCDFQQEIRILRTATKSDRDDIRQKERKTSGIKTNKQTVYGYPVFGSLLCCSWKTSRAIIVVWIWSGA